MAERRTTISGRQFDVLQTSNGSMAVDPRGFPQTVNAAAAINIPHTVQIGQKYSVVVQTRDLVATQSTLMPVYTVPAEWFGAVRLVDALVIPSTAEASQTVQVVVTAGTAVTDTMAAAVAGTIARAATISPTLGVFLPGEIVNLKFASGTDQPELFVVLDFIRIMPVLADD